MKEACEHGVSAYAPKPGGLLAVRCERCGEEGPVGDVRGAHEGWEALHGDRHRSWRTRTPPTTTAA